MLERVFRFLSVLGAVGGFGLTLAGAATAQPTPPAEPFQAHATGLVLESEAELQAFPKTPVYRAFLPDRVDLSASFPPPGDQGRQSACVGWAVGYAARSYYASTHDGRPIGNPANIPSPAYIYNVINEEPGNCGHGTRIPRALELLKSGALSLAQYPYNASTCRRPSAQQQSSANDFRIERWLTVDPDNLDQIKAQLAQHHPVILSWRVRDDFQRLGGGQVYRRATGPETKNFHAITAVGYDEGLQAFRLINSWGSDWGDGGFAWVGYEAFRSEVRSAFVMRPAGQPTPQPPPGPSPEPPPPPKPKPPPPPPKISGIDCGIVTVSRDGSGLHVAGFVGTQGEFDKAKKQAEEFKAASFDVAMRPWPQCEALMTLEKGLAAKDRPKIAVKRAKGADALLAGSDFVIDVETPSYPSFLQVTYIQADGAAVTLVQPETLSLKALAPHSKLTIGDGRDGGPKFRVVSPFGNEIVIAVASRSPLFTDKRPPKETERQFLTALRQAVLARPDPTAPARTFGAAYDAFTTKEQ